LASLQLENKQVDLAVKGCEEEEGEEAAAKY
jgi:hypothetical protein